MSLVGTRILTSDILARLVDQIPTVIIPGFPPEVIPAPYFGTSFDADFIQKFPRTFPAVWVIGSRARARDDGRGHTAMLRQHCEVEVALRLVVQRFINNDNVAESRLQTLHDQVTNALIGWTPPNAEYPLTWRSFYDGASSDAIIVADMILATQITYSRALP